jgi:hypothetical protein
MLSTSFGYEILQTYKVTQGHVVPLGARVRTPPPVTKNTELTIHALGGLNMHLLTVD